MIIEGIMNRRELFQAARVEFLMWEQFKRKSPDDPG